MATNSKARGTGRLVAYLERLQADGRSLSSARAAVAEKLDTSAQTVANIAAGGRPSAAVGVKLAQLLGVSFETLWREMEEAS